MLWILLAVYTIGYVLIAMTIIDRFREGHPSGQELRAYLEENWPGPRGRAAAVALMLLFLLAWPALMVLGLIRAVKR